MLKLSNILALSISLLILNSHASEQYRGVISATIFEKNGQTFSANNSRDTMASNVFDEKQVLYFDQSSGQKVRLTTNKVLFDNSKNSRYHLTVEISEKNDDSFSATVSYFKNSMQVNKKGEEVLVSTPFKTQEIQGRFNSNNQYSFKDDQLPSLEMWVNIDKVFSREELLNRLNKKAKKTRSD